MSHQKHLQETGRRFAYGRSVRSTRSRLAALRIAALKIAALIWLTALSIHAASAQQPATIPFTSIEAARSRWDASSPPDTGWVSVTLPDQWTERWPDFDGVVWYRLRWSQTDATSPVGMSAEYISMAGAVYVNGLLLSRDTNLVEPLTRSWNSPQYWLISAPLLRTGSNEALMRVSGLSANKPGLGSVVVGDPDATLAIYDNARWWRRDLQLFSLAVSASLCCFYFALWLMWRQETAYGWFGLNSLFSWVWTLNQVATSTWPFPSTNAWERALSVALLIWSACAPMFFLRFCRRSFPRTEAALWSLIACAVLAVIFAPQDYAFAAIVLRSLTSIVVFSLGCFALFYFTWRDRQTDQKILSFGVAVLLVAAIHDVLVTLLLHESNLYYTPAAYEFMLMGMALVLAWRFVGNIQQIRRFNEELTLKVDEARRDLATTLHRQHELEVVTARLGERLDLAHDLHDGLGGTLISSIATLEHEPQRIPPQRFLSILREILDDLRLIVDTASSQQPGNQSLAERIATLRHRLTGMCESLGITCRWQMSGLDQCHLPASQSLDLMRILREGLTNVLKHSQASRVEIELGYDDGALRLMIRDDGRGFDTTALDRSHGAGMRSMASRAKRLGGSFAIESTPGATMLSVHIPDPARFASERAVRAHAESLHS